MRFDLPSFLLGYGAAATTMLLGKQLRPLLLEMATLLYRLSDSLAAKASLKQENVEQLLGEARARARHFAEPAVHEQAQAR